MRPVSERNFRACRRPGRNCATICFAPRRANPENPDRIDNPGLAVDRLWLLGSPSPQNAREKVADSLVGRASRIAGQHMLSSIIKCEFRFDPKGPRDLGEVFG